MLSGGKILSSIGILGGGRCSVRPILMINLVTFPERKQRDQRSGSISSRVLISRMVPPQLSVRLVGRHSPTLSSGQVAAVLLLFGAMPSIRNVAAQEIVRGS